MFRPPPLLDMGQAERWSEHWAHVDGRLLIYTASLRKEPGPRPTEPDPAVRVLQIQDEIVLDSIAYHLLLNAGESHQAPVEGDLTRTVFVRDANQFEGTIECLCEPYETDQWLITLGEEVENRMTGQRCALDTLRFPLFLCFCRRVVEEAAPSSE